MAERVDNSGKGLDGSEELMEVWRSCGSLQMRGSGELLLRAFPKSNLGSFFEQLLRPDEVLSQKQKILNYFASKVKVTTLHGIL
ncbi:hypothetical protein VNO80_22162 [Phaseolus coccineus]|uniref:Uncharacterized protein n=1 Tax=Phaseolus coccineus TaxID=3886 RepID=A0AAN9M4C3_PHACN